MGNGSNGSNVSTNSTQNEFKSITIGGDNSNNNGNRILNQLIL